MSNKEATKQIQNNRNVDLAIPYVYSFKRGLEPGTNSPAEAVEQIDNRMIHGIRLEDARYWQENPRHHSALMCTVPPRTGRPGRLVGA